MRCDRHGRIAWELTIVCGGCGRFYQIVPDGAVFEPLCEGAVKAPERCECGKRLPPEQGVPGGGIFWARSCCTECFKNEMLKKGIVKLPIRMKTYDTADVPVAMRASAIEDGYTGTLKVVTSADEVVDAIIDSVTKDDA